MYDHPMVRVLSFRFNPLPGIGNLYLQVGALSSPSEQLMSPLGGAN